MEALLGLAASVGITAPLLGFGGGLAGLWDYNFSVWQFDRNQRQNQLHQLQNMRVQQAQMYREVGGGHADEVLCRRDLALLLPPDHTLYDRERR